MTSIDLPTDLPILNIFRDVSFYILKSSKHHQKKSYLEKIKKV